MPEYFWKVIKNARNEGIAIVTLNDPTKTVNSFCTNNICTSQGWKFNNVVVSRGQTFCCKVSDFKAKTASNTPDFGSIIGNLRYAGKTFSGASVPSQQFRPSNPPGSGGTGSLPNLSSNGAARPPTNAWGSPSSRFGQTSGSQPNLSQGTAGFHSGSSSFPSLSSPQNTNQPSSSIANNQNNIQATNEKNAPSWSQMVSRQTTTALPRW